MRKTDNILTQEYKKETDSRFYQQISKYNVIPQTSIKIQRCVTHFEVQTIGMDKLDYRKRR